MRYQILLKPGASRELGKLPKILASRVAMAIDSLGAQPRPPGCTKLAGPDAFWRIRVGDYRIIYQIHDRRLMILVIRVGHRREVYDL